MDKKHSVKVYFENLNSIRFIAASLVIIHHVEQLKGFFHLSNNFESVIINMIGKLGVVLFFVLSGFLISYLLFKEKEATSTISIRKFYIRRILRIWPLYFLIVFFAFFVAPFIFILSMQGFERGIIWTNIWEKLTLYIFFLPNLANVLYGVIPFASVAWSIGVEEQFYLIWPVLNKKINNKWILLTSVIVIYLLIKRYIYYLPDSIHDVAKSFWINTPIDCMAIGGIFALILYDKNKTINFLRKIIYSRITQWIVLISTVCLISIGFKMGGFYYEFYALMFGVLILNFAANPKRIFSMENQIMNYLGKISYGLYMFHSILILVSIRICLYLNVESDILLYLLSFCLTIGVASLSYQFFEKRFIDKKVAYSEIISGENAVNH